MVRRLPTILPAALAAALLLAACGDRESETTVPARRLVMVTETEAVSLPGQRVPASTDTVTLWLGPGLARRDAARGTFLVDAQRDLLTFVDHGARTWTRSTGAEVAGLLASLARDTLAGGDARLHRLKRALRVAAQVTDTGETDTVAGYACRRWVVVQTFGEQQTTTELWLTTDLDVDYSLLHRATQPSLAALPGGERALAELSRLRGVPVWSASVLQILGRQTRSETRLVEVVRDTVPVSFFAPPADYARTVEES